ncbi:FAD-dependent oxidoreductase [Fodinicola acaciae]|uniref:FAD-dependent oxidoreductase n=1 Tax=Fodinicola acaciae TaxID=2681555 RepID=UPI0013D08F52|nr:FAD-dependent oxidoreductase [Fodinicola acaciae]
MKERLVVIGGDAGGMAAASQARRMRGPEELEIVALERGDYTSYSACGIPYWVGDQVAAGPGSLVARDPQTFRDKFAVDVRLRHRVTSIDLSAGLVGVSDDGTGAELALPYDHLMIATGAEPVRPPWFTRQIEDEVDGIHFAQTLPQGADLRDDLEVVPGGRAVICGGGYIGVEIADALLRRGMDVTVVQRSAEIMTALDPDIAAELRVAMEKAGVTVRTGNAATGVKHRDGRVAAVLLEDGTEDGTELAADLVVLGLGVRPRTSIAATAGLELGVSGGLVTDEQQRVRRAGQVLERVYAAGDCTEVWHRVLGRHAFIPLGTHANKQSRVAGITIGGGAASFAGAVGTAITGFWSGDIEVEVGRTGLSCRELSAEGRPYVEATIHGTAISGYMPSPPSVTCRLVADPASGVILGGQLIGGRGVAKRIDAVSLAVWHKLAAADLVDADLGYCPPLSPTWDPIQIAARKLLAKLG